MWTDYRLTSVENQDQIWLPVNPITEKIYYTEESSDHNQRFIISPPVARPNAWYVSKIEMLHPIGILKVTLAQTRFNPNTDKKILVPQDKYIPDSEKFETWVADYAKSNLTPEPSEESEVRTDYCKITPSSNIFKVKVNGGYKKLTNTFYDSEGNVLSGTYIMDASSWSFKINDIDVNDLISLTPYTEDDYKIVKIKFLGDESYLNNILTVTVSDVDRTITTSIELEIVSL